MEGVGAISFDDSVTGCIPFLLLVLGLLRIGLDAINVASINFVASIIYSDYSCNTIAQLDGILLVYWSALGRVVRK